NEQARNAQQRFPNPESDDEIEDQYAIIQAATKQHAARRRWGREETCVGLKFAVERKVGAQREKANDSPANIICYRDAEMRARMRIVIYSPEEPPVPAKRDRIDDDIDEHEKKNSEHHYGPPRSRRKGKCHWDHAHTRASGGAARRQEKS